MSRIPLVYVIGPYRNESSFGVERNIFRARELGERIMAMGGMPVVPHANTARMDCQPEAFILEATKTLMLKCDAVATVRGWRASDGSKEEVRVAVTADMPVFMDEHEESLAAWIHAFRRDDP